MLAKSSWEGFGRLDRICKLLGNEYAFARRKLGDCSRPSRNNNIAKFRPMFPFDVSLFHEDLPSL